jgi:hypothetical protein
MEFLDYGVSPSAIDGKFVYVTHAQRDETENTNNSARRSALLNILNVIGPKTLPTSGAVFDVSRWDEANWGQKDGCLQSIYDQISNLDRQKGKQSSDANRWRDALIAETARENRLILVSNDDALSSVVRDFGIMVITVEDFLASLLNCSALEIR